MVALPVVLGAFALGASCEGDDGGGASTPVIQLDEPNGYAPDIDAGRFVEVVDHPYFPLLPGSTWVYESSDGSERIEVEVLSETREVMGIDATVVRDTVTEDGEVVEDTYDWFAQDEDGNVWYLGEDSTEYEDGEPVSKAGSWEAGVDGALPGIVMPADPQPGMAYRQEYYEGEAEDMAEVARLGETETVPYGSFDALLVIREWNPLEPEVVEEKYYAEGVGLVLEVKVAGEAGRVELIEALLSE